jgi:hypothetical protein
MGPDSASICNESLGPVRLGATGTARTDRPRMLNHTDPCPAS